jgi:hypothetical protein
MVHLNLIAQANPFGAGAMKANSLTASLLFVLLGDPASGQINRDLSKQSVLSEYRAAVEAWETRLSRADGVIRLTDGDPANKANPPRVVLYSFKCKLPDMASETETTESEGLSEQRVRGFNQEYRFSLRKKGGGREYSIDSLEARGADHPPISMPMRAYLFAPCAVQVASMMRVVTHPHFSVRDITAVTRDGKTLLRIAFDCPTDPPTKKGFIDSGGIEGSVLVSPEEKWALYEYECRRKKGIPMLYTGTIDYQGSLDGFPVPKRLARQRVVKRPKGDEVETQAYDFLEFHHTSPRDEEFTLAAFGIPEDVTRPSGPGRKGVLGYWLVALALAALAAAVFLKIASSRLREQARG